MVSLVVKKIIPLKLYGCKVVVTITDDIGKELIKFQNKNLINYQKTSVYYGMAIPEIGTDRYHVLLNKKLLDINTIAHEAFHISYEILESLGIEVSKENDEPLAYLLGYIVEEIYGMILKAKIKLQDGSSKKR